jgi:hypothetical protein
VRRIGVLTAFPQTDAVVLGGMEDQPHFKEAMLSEAGECDYDRIEAEVVTCARANDSASIPT